MNQKEVLKRYFGYDEFRPPQDEIISHVLAGRDALVLMPTGGGKSLCYQIPALIFPNLTLVISPLISLMKDQVDALNGMGIPAAFINSSLEYDDIQRVQVRVNEGRIKILYVAPERLAAASTSEWFKDLKLSLIAVDEAHCISEWGHDFRPEYRNLQFLRGRYPNVPILALTATATERVREDIIRLLNLVGGKTFTSSFNRPNLSYVVRPKQKAFAGLVDTLKQHKDESVIIYCFSRKDTEKLAEDLRTEGFTAAAYHAGLDPATRAKVQDRFIRDQINIITATIAFGMGINKPDVRLVVHYDLPKSIEGYYQETGRAGRDGLPAECVLFFTYADTRKHRYFIDQMDEGPEKTNVLVKLEQVLRYGQSSTCRRAQLLAHFGEKLVGSCENCDVCVPRSFATTEWKSLLKPASGPMDDALFQKLREVRKRIAGERHVPAYMIFGDKSLKDMAEKKPRDHAAFAKIHGVGAAKLESLADPFLAVINAHVKMEA